MFFGFKKYNGKRYFCLVRSYRKPGSKYPTNETVKHVSPLTPFFD